MLKKIIKKIHSLPLVWKLLGSYLRPNGVIVLMYHRIGDEQGFFSSFSVEKFSEQMQWIKSNCNVIHPDEIEESIKNNKKSKPNVLITFDDGYKCCYEHAYPILEELSLPALVFLATQPPDEGGMIWTDFLYFLIFSTDETKIILPWSNELVYFDGDERKIKTLSTIKSYLKQIDNKLRIKYLNLLEKSLHTSKKSNLNRQMLSWDEVRNSLSIVSYGGHTHTHPIMSKLTEDELNDEIKTCKERIFAETGIYPRSFAYPNGRYADYNELSLKVLKKHGYQLAFTTNEGFNDVNANLMEIKRVPTTAKNLDDFVWLISRMGQK